MATYSQIAVVNADTSTASITFTNISQAYTDLVVKIIGRSTTAATYRNMSIKFNNDTANHYRSSIYSTNSSIIANSGSNGSDAYIGEISAANSLANYFAITEVYISNYSSTVTGKPFYSYSCNDNNTSTIGHSIQNGLYNSLNAITQIRIDAQSITTGSKAYLYGIKNS